LATTMTPAQKKYLEAYRRLGTVGKAAKELGVSHQTISRGLKRAAAHDPELHTHTAPPGYHVKSATTLRDSDGKVKLQWFKTQADKADPAEILEVFAERIAKLPKAKPVPRPKTADSDLLTVYPMGDPHLGLLSWHLETGADFDLDIAQRNLVSATAHLVDLAPPSKTALIINLGDFYHSDSPDNRTARSGHALDVDSRWAKILRVGIDTMISCIEQARRKHKTVRIVNEIGNHDDKSSVMLSTVLEHHYRNDSGVEVDTSPAVTHWHEFGANLLGIHHGNSIKASNLGAVMASTMSEAWGRTKYRYWYTGHVHHESKKEYPGCIVESFRTLAARDAWHASAGYVSGRGMVCDVLHKTRGRIMRHEVGVESLP